MRRRVGRGLLLLATFAAGLVLVAAGDDPPSDERRAAIALAEGNRHFRDGRLEEALTSYREGYLPSHPNPTLVYNLATTLHHLDRLPEAILWYRRAAGSDDPWLEENLWLARRSLGSQTLPPGGVIGRLAKRTNTVRWLAVVTAWVGFVLLVSRRLGSWPVVVCAVLSAMVYLGAVAIDTWGPRPAVLLSDCASEGSELPAGTEAWVRPAPGGGWKISGTLDMVCPEQSLELVSARH